jgi:Ca2+/Na+ antiporter
VTLFALYHLERLLGNILAGEVFIRPNVRIIRRVCICCLAVCLICLPAAFFYPPLIFLCVIMAFLCPVVNVVRYVFDEAVTIREENDLTI